MDTIARGRRAFYGKRVADAVQSAFSMIRRMMSSEIIISTITQMHWTIVELDGARFELLTSHRPAVMSKQLNLPDSHILLPVGPHRLFVAVHNRDHSNWLRSHSHEELVMMINEQVLGGANQLVYGSDETQTEFVFDRLGKMRSLSRLEQVQEDFKRRKNMAM
ncbi:DUF4238 domain-containing protein [Mesorhizobium sp. M0408]|uniref:DUF4238 domain-containing protein n=1 Tax=Mesorhizobium sp. M0408 TaxID=2956942 RepID=UPI003334D186